MWDGPRPFEPMPPRHPGKGRYQPMRKQGAIILATGGDNSNSAEGNFYEGFMATVAVGDNFILLTPLFLLLKHMQGRGECMRMTVSPAPRRPAMLRTRLTRPCRLISLRQATRLSWGSSSYGHCRSSFASVLAGSMPENGPAPNPEINPSL